MEQFLNKTGNLFLFASLNWSIASKCMEHSYISIFLIVHILKSLFKIFFFNFFFFPFWITSIDFSLALLASSHFFFLDDGFFLHYKIIFSFSSFLSSTVFSLAFSANSHFFFLDDDLSLKNSSWLLQPQYQSTYSRGPESLLIEIPPLILWKMQILGLLGMCFDAVVEEVKTFYFYLDCLWPYCECFFIYV